MRGYLFAFEGTEGAGKSTQIRLAAEALRNRGIEPVITREPGGTDLGNALRELVMHRTAPPPCPRAELFLYLADRAQHIAECIRPALAANRVVLTDRFSGSTLAYQGAGRALDFDAVVAADAFSRDGIAPDLNLFLDLPIEIGLKRARGSDRFHAEEKSFHERVQSGFRQLAAGDRKRWCTIDSQRGSEEVHAEIMDALSAAMNAS